MSTGRRRYSRDFKLEAVRRIQETGQSQAQLSRELGVSVNTLSRWMRQFRSEKIEAHEGYCPIGLMCRVMRVTYGG